MDYFESAVRNINILLSIALIGVGGFVITMGWHILACWRVPNEAMGKLSRVSLVRRCVRWFLIFFLWITGTIMIGGGGILSTYGWNQLDNNAQKHAMIVAVAREWRLNNKFLSRCRFTVTDPNILAVRYQYPRFQWRAMDTLRNSALLNPNNTNDFDLLSALGDYELSVSPLQDRLDLADECLYAAGLGGGRPLNEHKAVNDSGDTKLFLSAHKALGDLLEREYFEDWLKSVKVVRSD